jgi:hypothetical protein
MKKHQSENESESVTLELPKNILDLVNASAPDLKEYLVRTLIEGVKADLDNQAVFTENLREKYKIA